jgi:hypothetical protein
MTFKIKIPVVVDVDVTVITEDDDQSYRISGIKPPSAAAFTRAFSADDAALTIESAIETRRLGRKGLVG